MTSQILALFIFILPRFLATHLSAKFHYRQPFVHLFAPCVHYPSYYLPAVSLKLLDVSVTTPEDGIRVTQMGTPNGGGSGGAAVLHLDNASTGGLSWGSLFHGFRKYK